MCGPSVPAPPDHSKHNAQLMEDARATNQERADEYNAQVSAFNNSLIGDNGLNARLGGFTSRLDDLDMTSLWDDPATEENENPYDDIMGQLRSIETEYRGLNSAPDAPDMIDSITGGGGETLIISGTPVLDSLNMDLYNSLGTGISDAISKLQGLQSSRRDEEARISGFGDDMSRSVSDMEARLAQMGIADKASMDQLDRELAALTTERDLFSSAILDQVGGIGAPAGFDSLRAGLADLRSQREAEQARIESFEAGLMGASDSIFDALEGATIADGELLDSLEDRLGARMREANRFSSELGFDLSQETGELSALLTQLQRLQGDRRSEEQRIDSASTSFRDRARALERLFDNGTIYDADTLARYGDDFSDLQDDMSGFSSDLAFDFSGLDPQMAEAQAALDGLLDRREAVINPLFERMSTLDSELNGLDLADVTGRDDLMAQIMDLRADLSPYDGGRADVLRDQIGDLLQVGDDQRVALSDRRGEINTQAEDLLAQITGGNYFTEADVSAGRTQLDELSALVDQFGATNASDEVADIGDFLQRQTNRLEQEAQNLAAREAQDQATALSLLNGDDLASLLSSSHLSDDEIAQILQMLVQAQEDQEGTPSPGVFSSNLGV